MELFPIADWVDSSELQNDLSEMWTPTLEEQERLVLCAHRPLEDKIKMMWQLQRWADSAEERELLRLMYQFLKFSWKQISTDVPGNQYHWDSKQQITNFSDFLSSLATEKKDWIEVVKYIPTVDGIQPLIQFTVERVDGRLSVTQFYYPSDLAQADFQGTDAERFRSALSRYQKIIRNG